MKPETREILDATQRTVEALRATVVGVDELKEFNTELATGLSVPEVVGPVAVKNADTEATKIVETPVVELSPELTARLEALNPEYKKAVLDQYNHRKWFTDHYITRRILPKDYLMPTLDYFIDMIEVGAETHAIFEQKGWQPYVGFVPKGLNDEQWDDMFIKYNQTKEGTWPLCTDHDTLVDPTETAPSSELWSYAITSATDLTVLKGVAKDGVHGYMADQAVDELQTLPHIPKGASADQVIAFASPAEATYRELQLTRVEQGQTPVDDSPRPRWTLIKENSIDTQYKTFETIVANYSSDEGSIVLFTDGLHKGHVFIGVRPSAEWKK